MNRLSSGLTKHKRFISISVGVFILYSVLALLLTWPLLSGLNSFYFSPETPGDGASIIADNWYGDYARQENIEGPVTRFYAYPFGFDLRGGSNSPLDAGLRNQLTRLFGAQAAFNLLIFLSFPIAGITMFFLLYYLTKSSAASFLGGLLYAFSPWHTSRAFDQVALTAIFTLPLFLFALVLFWRRRDWWSAAGLAAVSIIVVYTDLHFALFCTLIAVAWIAAALLSGLRGRGGSLKAPDAGSTRKAFALAALVIVVTAAAAAPIFSNASYKDPSVFAGAEPRGGKQTVDFSANPWNYVVPPAHALLWRGFTDDFVRSHLGLRTSNEVTAYPGAVTIALAVVALVLVFWRNRRRRIQKNGSDATEGPGLKDGVSGCRSDILSFTMLVFCLIAGITAFVMSLPPYYKVGGAKIPMPSSVIEALVPYFRYFCRWAIVVTFCLCLLAGIGFALLQKRFSWSAGSSLAICLILVVLFALDVTIIPPLRSKDFSRPPETLSELARYPKSEPVAIYPLAQGYEYATFHYRYFQRFHLHPMLNGTKPATEADLYRLSIKDIYSPYTPRMLAGLGVKKVVVLDRYFSNKDYGNYPYGVSFDPGNMPPGYKLAARTSDGYIYDVVAEPARVFPLYYSGFTPPSVLEDGRSWTVMQRPTGVIQLINKGPRSDYSLSITAVNPGESGELTYKLDGRKLGELPLRSGAQRLMLEPLDLPPGRHELSFEWNGEPKAIDGLPFRAGKYLPAYLIFSDANLLER
jgi:hypothetical protein